MTESTKGKFKPAITLDLYGPGGNIFAVIAACKRTALRSGWDGADVDEFLLEVTSTHSYGDALDVVEKHFDVKLLGRDDE